MGYSTHIAIVDGFKVKLPSVEEQHKYVKCKCDKPELPITPFCSICGKDQFVKEYHYPESKFTVDCHETPAEGDTWHNYYHSYESGWQIIYKDCTIENRERYIGNIKLEIDAEGYDSYKIDKNIGSSCIDEYSILDLGSQLKEDGIEILDKGLFVVYYYV